MTPGSVREYAEAVKPRYVGASRVEKGRLLDEFCLTTGYHRKAALRLLGKVATPGQRRPGRKVQYGPTVAEALKTIWQQSDYLCAKRLKPFLPELIAALERHGELSLDLETRKLVLQVSPATIDRLLHPYRTQRLGLRRPYLASRSTGSLKAQIPIRTFTDWQQVKAEAKVGYLEADLVAHCGDSTEGFYLHTLDVVDIVTGWSELVAVFGRQQERVGSALDQIRRRLPFVLFGLDCDNGTEFINQGLYDYCRRHRVEFTRSRAYRKNDQAHIEQRNWFIVRRLVGYDRYSTKEAHAQLSRVYELVQEYVNHFEPIRKLVSKERVAGKVQKRYDEAQTPYQRLMASGVLTAEQQTVLRRRYERLNPVRLREQLEVELERLWQLRDKSGEASAPKPEPTRQSGGSRQPGGAARLTASGGTTTTTTTSLGNTLSESSAVAG